MATAAGTAVLLYLVLSGRLCGDAAGDDGALEDQLISSALEARRRRKEDTRARREQRRAPPPCTKRRWPERPPDGWGEAAALTARTVGFTWAETLGKWTLGEVAFGIKYYMRQQGNLQHEYAGSDSVLLDGAEVRQVLISLLRYLKQCMYFSKKPYNVFLEYGGYGHNDVLIRKPKARGGYQCQGAVDSSNRHRGSIPSRCGPGRSCFQPSVGLRPLWNGCSSSMDCKASHSLPE